jgi:hypothetical protein
MLIHHGILAVGYGTDSANMGVSQVRQSTLQGESRMHEGQVFFVLPDLKGQRYEIFTSGFFSPESSFPVPLITLILF